MFLGIFGIGLLLPSLDEPEHVCLVESYHAANSDVRDTPASN